MVIDAKLEIKKMIRKNRRVIDYNKLRENKRTFQINLRNRFESLDEENLCDFNNEVVQAVISEAESVGGFLQKSQSHMGGRGRERVVSAWL